MCQGSEGGSVLSWRRFSLFIPLLDLVTVFLLVFLEAFAYESMYAHPYMYESQDPGKHAGTTLLSLSVAFVFARSYAPFPHLFVKSVFSHHQQAPATSDISTSIDACIIHSRRGDARVTVNSNIHTFTRQPRYTYTRREGRVYSNTCRRHARTRRA